VRVKGPYTHEPPIGSSQKELDLKREQKHHNMLAFVAESDEKTAAKRVFRQQAALNRELEIERNLEFAEAEKRRLAEQHEQEILKCPRKLNNVLEGLLIL